MPLTPEVGPTPKQNYWEQIVLPAIPDLVAGSYTNPYITVSESGLITVVANGVNNLPVVANVASLSTVSPVIAGTTVVVLDDGMGNIVLFSWKTTPSAQWYQITFPPALGAQSVSFDHTSAFPLSIATVQPIALWKRMAITVKTAFSAGTALSLVDSNAVVWFATTLVNPLIPGTYDVDMPGNDVPVGLGPHLFLSCTGSPSVGAGVVYVEYIQNA